MRSFSPFALALLCTLFSFSASAQLSLTNSSSTYTINFDTSVSGVNIGTITGNGFTTNPAAGQLDADAWSISGLSDGFMDYGQNRTSGDFARGNSSGGVSSGGAYAFTINNGNRALGFQPTGSDFTPGNLNFKIVNNTGNTLNEVSLTYTVYVRNDQNRSSSVNFSYSTNNSNFQNVPAVSFSTPAGSSSSPSWVPTQKTTTLSGLNIAAGNNLYLRWSSADVSGSGSRDEIALDDIVIGVTGGSENCTSPSAQPNSLNFGSITANLIQGIFNASSADKFLVVRTTSSTLSSTPIDGVNYPEGSALGNGTVVQYDGSTSFSASGLTANTSYTFHVFSANDDCIGGPSYRTTNPLKKTATTLSNGSGNYYDMADGQTCFDLKNALYTTIKDHTVKSYGYLWTLYQDSDDRANDSGNATIVWDMYSDNPNGSENEFTFVSEQCGTFQGEGDCYNREHSFPKSWWGGSTSVPQYTDAHMVIPVDGWINGIRSNYPYGEVRSATRTMANGTKLGSTDIFIPGYTDKVFEPIDAYKGDIARIYFYMATRYENNIGSWENINGFVNAVLDGSSDKVFEDWALDMFTQWHEDDPVSQKEIDRNESIFNEQGNRNPFIDHPEWVNLVWGENCANGGGNGSTVVLAENSFETGWEGWQDGGGDCYRYNGSRSFDGNYSIRIRDNSSTASSMTSATYDLTGFNSVTAEFSFYSYSMETGEDFWFRYHDGVSWETIKAYRRGTDFENNNFYSVTASFSAADYNFVSNGRFRFQCDASSNADIIYIDKVKITASSGSGNRNVNPNSLEIIQTVSNGEQIQENVSLEEFIPPLRILTNPANSFTTLEFTGKVAEQGLITVTNLNGDVVMVREVAIEAGRTIFTLDVSELRAGMYILKLNTASRSEAERLVVIE